MRIRRIALENYRGVEKLDLMFPRDGITIVTGPNESGKSSLFEALDLLLERKDSSRHAGVRAVWPVHVDAPTRIEAELELGPHRLTYAKQLQRSPRTELRISGPRPESLTGDEAHERVRELLEAHLDLHLWRALRIQQGEGLVPVELPTRSSLARALEEAAGRSAAGGAQSLLEAAQAELEKYLTPIQRRPGKRLLESRERVDTLAEREATLVRQLRELDEHSERCAALDGEIAQLRSQRAAAERAGERARADVAALERLDADRERAALAVDASGQRLRHAEARLRERLAQARELEAVAARLAESREREQGATEALARATEACRGAREALIAAESRAGALAKEQATVQDALERAREREALARLRVRVERAEALLRERSQAQRAAESARVTDAALREFRQIWDRKIEAEASLRATAASLEIESRGALDVEIDGERVRVDADSPLQARIAEAAEWSGDGLKVRVRAGADSREIRASLKTVERDLDGFAARYGVRTLEAASEAGHLHRVAREQAAAAQRELEALVETSGHASLATLREELDRREPRATYARDAMAGELPLAPTSEATHRARLTEIDARVRACAGARAARREALDRAQEAAAAAAAELERERARRAMHEAEREKLRAAIEAGRQAQADAVLEADVASRRTEHGRAQADAAAIAVRRTQLEESAPRETLVRRQAALEAISSQLRGKEQEQTRLQAILSDRGEDGLGEALTATRGELHRARTVAHRDERRARAARLLVETLEQERDAARARYADALIEKIEALGRPVFGDDFRVTLDANLGVAQRTLEGRTVDYASLSVGAREQLGLIVRLACAILVGRTETSPDASGVPLVLDDALGHSDLPRTRKLADTLVSAAHATQIILLTCSPERYRWLPDAHRIELA